MSAQSTELLGSSTKNAYLITSDLHKSYINLRNRFDYPKEVEYAESKIIECATKYKNLGYTVNRLSLGDEFHNSYRDVDKAMKDQNSAISLASTFNKTFICLGNHDFTYYKGNPLWHLISRVNDTSVHRTRKRGWTPKGVIPFINVVDRFSDGEVEFVFNHYNSNIKTPDPSKYTIGLFHQDIVFREILDEAKLKFDNVFELDEGTMITKHNYVYLDETNQLTGYSHCFHGHSHMLYGTWEDDNGTTNHYMASLGRTTHKEVRDDFLERNIGVILVENGKLSGIEFFKFNLMDRASCVDETKVRLSQEKYEKSKENNAIKSYKGITDDPIVNIKSSLNNSTYDYIIDSILNDSEDVLFDLAVNYL